MHWSGQTTFPYHISVAVIIFCKQEKISLLIFRIHFSSECLLKEDMFIHVTVVHAPVVVFNLLEANKAMCC